MFIKKLAKFFSALLLLTPLSVAAYDENGNQIIQIKTRLHSFIGKPSWLLIIRDVVHGQNIPYLFDFRTGENTWIAFTYSRDYVITVSNLQFSPYSHDPYTVRESNNFCHLESQGRIIHGQSMIITLTGNLTPFGNTYSCIVNSYEDLNFPIVP